MTVSPLLPSDPGSIGAYALSGRRRAGGMGIVYLAETPGGAKVALKVLHAQLLHEPGLLTRFGREVEALRRVNVAGTARVLDADLTANPPYLVTEFLDGESLEGRVARQGPLSATAVTQLLAGLTGRDLPKSVGTWRPTRSSGVPKLVGSASIIASSCDSSGTPLGVTFTGLLPSTRHRPTSTGTSDHPSTTTAPRRRLCADRGQGTEDVTPIPRPGRDRGSPAVGSRPRTTPRSEAACT